LEWKISRINNPLNGITVCRQCHKKIHNGERDKKVIYWNVEFDDYLRKKAFENTLAFEKKKNIKKIKTIFDSRIFNFAKQLALQRYS